MRLIKRIKIQNLGHRIDIENRISFYTYCAENATIDPYSFEAWLLAGVIVPVRNENGHILLILEIDKVRHPFPGYPRRLQKFACHTYQYIMPENKIHFDLLLIHSTT